MSFTPYAQLRKVPNIALLGRDAEFSFDGNPVTTAQYFNTMNTTKCPAFIGLDVAVNNLDNALAKIWRDGVITPIQGSQSLSLTNKIFTEFRVISLGGASGLNVILQGVSWEMWKSLVGSQTPYGR